MLKVNLWEVRTAKGLKLEAVAVMTGVSKSTLNKIHTDRGRLVDTSWEMQTEFSTPDLKDGFQIDVYVDPNLIEVFVNDGEYIISNCVYNLGTDIHQQGNVKYEMYTLEGTDVSEV